MEIPRHHPNLQLTPPSQVLVLTTDIDGITESVPTSAPVPPRMSVPEPAHVLTKQTDLLRPIPESSYRPRDPLCRDSAKFQDE